MHKNRFWVEKTRFFWTFVFVCYCSVCFPSFCYRLDQPTKLIYQAGPHPEVIKWVFDPTEKSKLCLFLVEGKKWLFLVFQPTSDQTTMFETKSRDTSPNLFCSLLETTSFSSIVMPQSHKSHFFDILGPFLSLQKCYFRDYVVSELTDLINSFSFRLENSVEEAK